MGFVARVHVWIAGEILYASDLNTEFNNLCNNILPAPATPSQGDIYFYNGTIWTRLPAGVAGLLLRTQGALADPKWDSLIEADLLGVSHSWLAGLDANDHPQYLLVSDYNPTIPEISRVTTITSSANPTINTDNCDAVTITALAEAITSMTTNLSGTPVNFQKLIIRIKDNGVARAITWGAKFVAKGVSLPTTTVASKCLTVGFLYDTVAAVWGCVAKVQEN